MANFRNMSMKRFCDWMGRVVMAVMAVVMLGSCDGGDPIIVTPDGGYSTHPRVQLNDDEAGTFTVMNMTSGEQLELRLKDEVVTASTPIADCYAGDTLKVTFTKKDVYRGFKFDVDCRQLKKISDSLFVVPNYEEEMTEKMSMLSMNIEATYTRSTPDSVYQLKATNDCYITYRSYFYFELKYIMTMSSDLLRYVRPEVTFTDLEGKEQKVVLTEKDFANQSSHILVYEDAQGETHEIKNDERQPEDGWTFLRDYYIELSPQFEAVTGFTKRGTTMTATVRYLPTEAALTEEHCNFERTLRWQATGYSVDGIEDRIGNVGDSKLEKAREYLQRLYATTDVIRLAINKKGEISEK